jgi:hypothetical protein
VPKLKLSTSMKDKDSLGCVAGFSLKSYGVRVSVRSNDAAALERVCGHLPSEWERTSSLAVDRVYSILVANKGTRRLNFLYGDDVQLSSSKGLTDIFERFESDLRLFVAELATHHVFVHAGAVGWKGQAILIPGRSFSGKSTLVAELVRAGATYYSDEYAVLDARGRVHPFSKPLELREEGDHRQTKITVAELGGQAGTKPLPVGLVLITEYKNGARWRPRKLTAGNGVLQMLFNTVSARRSPGRALATLQRVAASADVLKGVRGDAGKVVPAVLQRVETKLKIDRQHS